MRMRGVSHTLTSCPFFRDHLRQRWSQLSSACCTTLSRTAILPLDISAAPWRLVRPRPIRATLRRAGVCCSASIRRCTSGCGCSPWRRIPPCKRSGSKHWRCCFSIGGVRCREVVTGSPRVPGRLRAHPSWPAKLPGPAQSPGCVQPCRPDCATHRAALVGRFLPDPAC